MENEHFAIANMTWDTLSATRREPRLPARHRRQWRRTMENTPEHAQHHQQRMVNPTDLCRLKASAGGPCGILAIPCIHQPQLNWTVARRTFAQCRTMAVRV